METDKQQYPESLSQNELFHQIAKEENVTFEEVENIWKHTHIMWMDPKKKLKELQTNPGKASYIKWWLNTRREGEEGFK